MSIELKNINHTYMKNTPFEKTALKNINLRINDREYLAIAGHTGSGKSTLIQLMAGLMAPTSGNVLIDNIDLSAKDKSSVRQARLKVGIVFQYPETQLFEETVEKDIAFGPRNLNLNESEINERIEEAMKLVSLPETVKTISPFNLSGGQKRKVAIAGVLAMKPKYLILDEPTAGLDPRSRDEMMNNIQRLHNEQGVTIILISHSMDDIAKFAGRVVILSQGNIIADDAPDKIFCKNDILKAAGLLPPSATQLLIALKSNGLNINTNAITIDEAEQIISSGKILRE